MPRQKNDRPDYFVKLVKRPAWRVQGEGSIGVVDSGLVRRRGGLNFEGEVAVVAVIAPEGE
jgi:hypothetical protein